MADKEVDKEADGAAGQSAVNEAGRLAEESAHLEVYKATEGASDRLILVPTDLFPNGAAGQSAVNEAGRFAEESAHLEVYKATEGASDRLI